MVAAGAGRIRGKEMYSQTAYLDRAKQLRDTADVMPDARAQAYLIRAAEAYERMAGRQLALLLSPGRSWFSLARRG